MSLICEYAFVRFAVIFLTLLLDSIDVEWSLTFKLYTPTWKRHRRLFTQCLNHGGARLFLHQQVSATHTLLRSLLHDPTELRGHLKHAAANFILDVTYGYKVKPVNDPFVELAERAMCLVNQGLSPGAYLVNVFPWRES